MATSHTLRIVSDILLLVMAFLVPWWLFAPLALVALFFFGQYIEIIVFGFLLDCVYGTGKGFDISLFTILGFFLFLIQLFMKEKMRLS